MAKRIISLKMEDELIDKLDEVAKSNHRKRGPEINVAVEFYLKYQGVDLESIKTPKHEANEILEDTKEETTEVNMGNFGFND